MRIFGLDIKRARQPSGAEKSTSGWRHVYGYEHYPGAWQNNDELTKEGQLGFFAVYACVNLISNDIGKLRPFVYKYDEDSGIKVEQRNDPLIDLLLNPNHIQNHIQFKTWWAMSKLTSGNTYALKRRNNNGRVQQLYVLEPSRVVPLVSTDGEVFYQLNTDNIAGISDNSITVPASEIIHDRINCLYHPLVGISPLYACGLSAGLGQAIQKNSERYFKNGQQPGGILTAPGAITKETSDRLKTAWAENYGGENYGKIAVVGDGLKYEPMAINAHDSQLIEQLRMTGEVVCSAFGVPAYMAQIGPVPNYDNAETLVLQYYSQCLQSHIEQMELAISQGLGIDVKKGGIEFSLDGLLRMDTATKHKTMSDSIKGCLMSPNEARKRINLPPLEGGDSIYMQQQNYSMEALAKRDELSNPFNPGASERSIDYDGERTFKIDGQEFQLPIVIDRGVYDAERDYSRGDSVSHGGSLWIAQLDSPDHKPGEGSGWRLAVKRGRAAK